MALRDTGEPLTCDDGNLRVQESVQLRNAGRWWCRLVAIQAPARPQRPACARPALKIHPLS